MIGPNTLVSPDQVDEVTQLARWAARNVQARQAQPPTHEGWADGTQDFAEKFRRFRLPTPWFHKVWYTALDDPTRTHIYVQAAREHAKCLVGDTRVVMADGSLRRIDSLTPGEMVMALDDRTFSPTRVVHVQSNGVQPVFRLETRRGRRVTSNAEHRFLTWSGWRRLEDLRPGDRIAAPRRYDIGGCREPEAHVRLIALLLGDGCMTKGNSASFTNGDPRVLDDFVDAAQAVGFDTRRSTDKRNGLGCVSLRHGPIGEWLREWDAYQVNSATKRVPDRIFRSDQSTQALFLNRLFACDGHATCAGNGIIGYASKSRELIDGVSHLLLRLGIACSVQKNETKSYGTQWRLAIGTRSDIERFAEVVGIFGKEGALLRLQDFIAKRRFSNDRIDLVPSEWRAAWTHGDNWFRNHGLRVGGRSPTTPRKVLTAARLLSDTDLEQRITQLTWLEITSIEPAGEAEVWDIETESHTFIANDVVTHNTSVVLTYALKRLCEDPHVRIGIISGSDPLAMAFLREIKYELESNQELIHRYNNDKPFVGEKWTEHELVLSSAHDGPNGITGKDVSVFSVGRGSQISSRHCDILIADDVESAASVKSELVRQGTREWWAREVGPVLSPGGKFIVAGTRKSYDDLYAHLMADPTWTVLSQAKSVFDADGEPIWPEMWDKSALLTRKAQLDAQDVLAWPQEYLNEPLPSETQMFHPELWPQYTEEPWAKARGMIVLQFWDLAISEKTTSDFTVGVTIGVDDSNNIYLLELRRGHWAFNRTLDEIGSMGHGWPTVSRVGIEQIAYQAAAVQEALRRTMLPIVPMVPDKDKVTRARLLEARANAGKVYRPVKSAWWADLAQECAYFPAGAHDDIVDALSGGALMAGWSADSVSYAYGVWTCVQCKHMFTWHADRPCPKCGTKAPATYDNPDVESYGGMLEDQSPMRDLNSLPSPLPASLPSPQAGPLQAPLANSVPASTTVSAQVVVVPSPGSYPVGVQPMTEQEPVLIAQMHSPEPVVLPTPEQEHGGLPPQAPSHAVGARIYTLEVFMSGTDAGAIRGLASTIEQMGSQLVERDGRYFVATTNANYMRTFLAQQVYVQSVI